MRNLWSRMAIPRRLNIFIGLAGIVFSRNAGEALRLCELVTAMHFSGIPRTNLGEILSRLDASYGNRRVTIHPLLRGGGSGAAGEMAILAALVAVKHPNKILEFGTYDGFSTWHLWANSDAEIVTIDLAPNTQVAGSSDQVLQGVARRPFLPDDRRIRLVEMDSRSWEPNVDGIDFCFIDAGHTYECVKNDTEKALCVMAHGGLIVWHDATWRRQGYGVNAYLKDLRRRGFDIHLVSTGMDFSNIAMLQV